MIKSKISFVAFFKDVATGGQWQGLPRQLKDLLEADESFLSCITERMEQDRCYEVEISFKKIDKK